MNNRLFGCLGILVVSSSLFIMPLQAVNDLTVRDPADAHSSDHQGYIDTAVIVVEPHGGYTEYSLYLDYSDHNQFPGNEKLEIVHHFELPERAVIDDMWLWIGDSVMQAIMLDTWTASHIYDSIVVTRKDPCLVTKRGSQYIMNVYPLVSGSYRRVKLNYIVPTGWFDGEPYTMLPLDMLKAGIPADRPIQVLFRTQSAVWGYPVFRDIPQTEFYSTIDTAGYSYMQADLNDWSSLDELVIDYRVAFTAGYTGNSFYKPIYGSNYYQIGLDLPSLFNIPQQNDVPQRKLIGLDVSGLFENNLSTVQNNLTSFLPGIIADQDSFMLALACNGSFKFVGNQGWIPGEADSISKMIQKVLIDPDITNSQHKPHIVFYSRSSSYWKQGYFDDIGEFATYDIVYNLDSALAYMGQSDIVSEYIVDLDEVRAALFINALTDYLQKGGYLLSYAYPGVINWAARHFIDGFKCSDHSAYYGKLYRTGTGVIASSLPDVVDTYGGHYKYSFTDTAVNVEAVDSDGDPVIVSKKVENGVIVLNSLNINGDESAMARTISMALLGLNTLNPHHQLEELLDSMAVRCNQEAVDECFVLSNAEQLVMEPDKTDWLDSYLSSFSGTPPVFQGINLLTGSPYTVPSVTYRNIEYLGGGYQLKMLADSTGGNYYGLKNASWEYIVDNLMSLYPSIDSISVQIDAVGSTIQDGEHRFVSINKGNIAQPIFVIGNTGPAESLHITIAAEFENMDTLYNNSFGIPVGRDSILAARYPVNVMLTNEQLMDFYEEPVLDTQKIVTLAIQHNVLTDFTALIALEPDDSIHFMQEPLEENTFTPLSDIPDSIVSDSVSFTVEPNPFTGRATIAVSCKPDERVSVVIYDLQGNEVVTLLQEGIPGKRNLITWQGRDRYGEAVKPGIYITGVFRNGKPEFLPVVKRRP